jgi:hypothetical protein
MPSNKMCISLVYKTRLIPLLMETNNRNYLKGPTKAGCAMQWPEFTPWPF